jgi:hypothetical protein
VNDRNGEDDLLEISPELQELFDAAREEEARMRRDLVAVLAAEERRLDAAARKKKAWGRVATWAAVLVAAASALAVATSTVLRGAGDARSPLGRGVSPEKASGVTSEQPQQPGRDGPR